jgi:MFS family permease
MPTLRPVGALFLVFGTFWGAWAVSVADIKRSLDLSTTTFGILLSIALLGAAVTNNVAGVMAERHGTGRALVVTTLAWSALLAVAAACTVRAVFVPVFVVLVAAGGAVDVVMNIAATAALGSAPGRLVRFHALFNAGAVVGALGMGVVLRAGGSWRIAWPAIAVAGVAAAVAAARREVPGGASGAHTLRRGIATVWREGLVAIAVVFALAAMVEGGVDTWGVLYLREHLASGLLVGTAAYVLGQSVATSARVLLGPAAGALGAIRGVAVGGLTAAGGLGLMVATSHPAAGAAGLVLAAGGISVCWPLLLAHATRATAEPGLVVGGVTSVGYLGFVLGPALVGGVAGHYGLAGALVILVGAALAVGVTPIVRAATAASAP